ncbi:hypothetical protein A9Q84_17735 [Halobacteriovorax marinus]|uniref:FecR protein domain-containing protein n=1 Tax=Halobacteriovorax marinus TaxID=97084 RepID=A0A1Y5F385_9BACT|nr:hypothetical protein A9Q84_17735 [Halobacteriovorax marinus]
MKIFAISLIFLASISIWALPTGTVSKLRGEVYFNGKLLKTNDVINTSGILKSKRRSFIKLAISEWNTNIVVGPNSEMKIDLSSKAAPKKYSFLKGRCRWKTNKNIKSSGVIHTNQASLGVRGTDYLLIVNSLLGETEIVVFDGLVDFKNATDKADVALLKKNQWGGLGGRYGAKIGKVLDLPTHIISAFDKQLKL